MLNVVLLVSQETKQRYVAREVSRCARVSGIVVEQRYTAGSRLKSFLKSQGRSPLRIAAALPAKAVLAFLERGWTAITDSCFLEAGRLIPWPSGAEVMEATAINAPAVAAAVKRWQPDVIAVFGTGLVGPELARIPGRCIINVHTGLSPYYRGGQCAFWALYNREPEYIGVTVHYLNQGIDRGKIIYSSRLPLTARDNLARIECRLCILATRLLTAALRALAAGPVPGTPQWTRGKLFLSRQFTMGKRIRLHLRMRMGLMQRLVNQPAPAVDIRTFPPQPL